MTTLARRSLVTAAVALAVLAATGHAVHTAHSARAAVDPGSTMVPALGAAAPTVDGFRLTHLPPGLGPQVSDFSYEWGGVGLRSKVWESANPSGGYRVDLTAHVLRGDTLTSAPAMRRFLTTYLEREDWSLDPVQVGGDTGYLGSGDVFWLVRPGVGVWVSADPDRFGRDDLRATAAGVRPVR